MAKYIMLLHEKPSDFSEFSAEEIQKVIGEYVAWRKEVEAQGKLADSSKLKDEGGKHLSMQNGQLRVTDGPYTEAKELLGGYFVISAASYEEAIEISQTCPHLKYGGWIELREIEPTA